MEAWSMQELPTMLIYLFVGMTNDGETQVKEVIFSWFQRFKLMVNNRFNWFELEERQKYHHVCSLQQGQRRSHIHDVSFKGKLPVI